MALYVAEGVQLYRRVSLFFDDTDRINRILPHGVVMALGLVHMTIGIALKIKQKVDLDKAHFESNHAIIGKCKSRFFNIYFGICLKLLLFVIKSFFIFITIFTKR